MSATAAKRARGPELRRNTLPSFAAAVAMHGLLILGMWFAVQWRTTSESPAVAELWEPLAPMQPPAPPPEPAPAPAPEAARPEAEIVQQQQVKPHAQEQPSPPPVEHRANVKPEPKKAEPKKVEPKKEPSPQQLELINGCIRPHISIAVPHSTPDKVYAEFKVELLPTGEQAAPPQLIKSSGLPGYDDAAERAIIRCDPFPRDKDGTVPRPLSLKLYPTVTR
jgi:colicin import membrane protein